MGNRLFVIVSLLMLLLPATKSFAVENSSDLYKKASKLALKGSLDESITIFKKVVQLSPHYCLGHYGLGKAYLHKEGKLDDAVFHLAKSVDLDKKFVKGYFYLGMAYYMNMKYVQAIHSFKKAYDYDYSVIESLYNIGAIYDLIGNSYKSKIYFKRYLDEKYRDDDDIFFR
jgi:tetratricopeptide (TPR) repeat protein